MHMTQMVAGIVVESGLGFAIIKCGSYVTTTSITPQNFKAVVTKGPISTVRLNIG